MKRMTFLLLLGIALISTVTFAAEMVEAPDSCKYCGMDRTKFAHSRMLVEYDDHSSTGTCSLHCLAIELANNIDKTPVAVKVGGYNNKQIIDAESAVWVIGGEKQGVMTGRAKWAFANKAEAEEFIKENKGQIATFDEAMKASYEDMYKDTKMIRDKRKQKRMKMEMGDKNPSSSHGHDH